jgi:hypothetical protein
MPLTWTAFHSRNSDTCHLHQSYNPYTPAQIAVFPAYVIPANTFYILPLAATHNQPDILLSPHSKNSKYAQYKEAWQLLMTDPHS